MHKPANADLLLQFPKAIAGHPHATAPVQNILDTTAAQTTFDWKPIPFDKTLYVYNLRV